MTRDQIQEKVQEKLNEVMDKIQALTDKEAAGEEAVSVLEDDIYLTGRLDGLMSAFHIICGLEDYPYPEDTE